MWLMLVDKFYLKGFLCILYYFSILIQLMEKE